MIDISVEKIEKLQTSSSVLLSVALSASALFLNEHQLQADTELQFCHDQSSQAVSLSHYINIDVTRVTEFSIADYLKVDKDVVWVTPEIYEQLLIMSNIDWTIT